MILSNSPGDLLGDCLRYAVRNKRDDRTEVLSGSYLPDSLSEKYLVCESVRQEQRTKREREFPLQLPLSKLVQCLNQLFVARVFSALSPL